MKSPLFLIATFATILSVAAQTPSLSPEGEKQRDLHDYLFETFAEGRETKYVGEGRDRGLKELTIFEKTREIRDGDEVLLPEGAEQVAVFFRHFGFRGENLDRIKEVRVLPFSPEKSPPRSVQVKDFYRVQMPSLPVTDEPFGRMKIRFLMKEEGAVARIDDLVFYAQNAISPEFDTIPFRDLGSEFPREKVEIRIDTDHELSIGGTAELQREKFFRMHETPGEVHPSIEKWAYDRGFLPGRGAFKFNPGLTKSWGGQETLKERGDKPGAADLTIFERIDTGTKIKRTTPEWSGVPFAMTFNDWPEFMSVPLTGRGTPLVEHFDDAAALAAAYAADQVKDAGYTAAWWEVKNESSVKSEWAHHHEKGLDGWGLLADFHNRVADAVHESAPGAMVGGPSSAYMQVQVSDFGLYRSQARFIEETRGHLDFFSHHFYENAGMLGAHERRDLGYSNYLLGRYEGILDMLRAHMHKVDNVLPILITETGSLQNGREPSDNWLRLLAWNAYLTKSMQRPDQIDLFVPFIFLHMPWNPNSGDAAFAPKEDRDRHTVLEDFEPTTVANYFELWRDFDGNRLPVSFDRDWLDVVAVHDGDRISLAVTNMGGRQISADLSGVAEEVGANAATQTRLNYHGGQVVFEPEHEVDAAAIPIDVNETTVIRLSLPEALTPAGTLEMNRWYAEETAVKSEGAAVPFSIDIEKPDAVKSAQLLIGIHRNGGLTGPLAVTLNGTSVPVDTGDAAEFSEFFAPLDATFPADLLREKNEIEIDAQSGATITSVQIVTHSSAKMDQAAKTAKAASRNAQPNILWIVTDDQRADSIAAFNKMIRGSEDSALGKVLSPNVDRLAAMGTTFLNTFNQNPGCAPSRTLMHSGRYSHRTGVYGFEYYTPIGQPHWHPMIPQILRDEAGYQTVAVGKLGIRAQDHTVGPKAVNIPLYETFLGYCKEFAAEDLVDWNADKPWADGKPGAKQEIFYFEDGSQLKWNEGDESDDREAIKQQLDLLRHYHPGEESSDGEILGGVNPQSADETRDASFLNALLEYQSHPDEAYADLLGRQQEGPTSDKPLFAYCGFDFPHTPVLPPEAFRRKFSELKYEIPELSEAELAAFPPQILKLYKNAGSDHFTDEEKHQMIADYYAFCAYGDSLVGRAVDGFIEFSEKQARPWMIVYVCGDHGWRLNEHGMVSKFSHYDVDLHNPIIVATSEKSVFPAGKVVEDFTTFLDMAPTFYEAAGLDTSSESYDWLDGQDLAGVASGEAPKRDYIIAEPSHVIGPRALIRTQDYKFAMKVKTQNQPGKGMDWALSAKLEEIEPTLFDLRSDPDEILNLAFEPRYRPVVDTLRKKLQDIVLGDGRVEVAWTKEGDDEVFTSDFAPGADDGKLEVPAPLTEAAVAALPKKSAKPKPKSQPKTANAQKPNIVLVFADDISARELPLYGSTVWSPPLGGNTSDPQFRAKTPALDQLAEDGCWISTAWASTVCSPSRAMMMTGRYAHRHKWWTNGDIGEIQRENGKREKWPLYESSPLQLGHLAQQAGYGTFWTGKTQMAGDLREFGFDEGCFTPGNLSDTDNPHTDFKHEVVKEKGSKRLINTDTGETVDTYQQHGWYWYPHVRLMNHPSQKGDFGWWPNNPEAQKSFGPQTYGPDVELDFAFEFMERKHAEGKPFFIYHCSHLGHDAYNWLDPDDESKWPGTPKVEWDGKTYIRTQPNITGDQGDYDTHGTVTESGIHTHINYLDYQMWCYREKLEEIGIADNTIVIFCADNGTSGYGKHSPDRQKGTHVPMIIYAPGMKKHGEQDVLLNLSDFLPTFADVMGVQIPEDYEIDGESFLPFLMSDKKNHRKWVYGYRGAQQLIRGRKVMKDGFDKWWDVSETPDDLISFPEITNWPSLSQEHRNERNRFREILPQFDLHATEHDAPGTPSQSEVIRKSPKPR